MRLGIKSKWALFSFFAVAFAVVPASAYTLYSVNSEMRDSAQRAAENVGAQLAAFSTEALVAEDDLALDRGVQTTLARGGVHYAVVYAADGTVQAARSVETDGPIHLLEKIEALVGKNDAAAARALGVDEPSIVHMEVPISVKTGGASDTVLGGVRVGYSFADREAQIRRFTMILTGANVAGLLLGMFVGMQFAKKVARPIVRLQELASTVAKGNFEVSAPIDSNDELGALAQSFNAMTAFLRKGKFMRHAFERYVSAELADRIEKDPRALELKPGERREVTILFLDVRGFTKRAEKMSAEDVVKFLVALFDRVSEPVFKAEGMIDKFIGDAMLSVFGFPIAHEDDPFRAVVSAVRIQEDIRNYNRERMAWGLEPVGVGIGINTGTVVAGNIGCQRKLEYTVIGDAVNVAARLVALAQPGQVLVSGSTYEKIQTALDAKFLGMQQVKGREQPVAVYEVNGLVYGKVQSKPATPAA